MENPCNDLFEKQTMAARRRNNRVWPTTSKLLKQLCGHSRAMYWCYILIDLTLNCHFSLAFGLGRSVNPPGPSFAIALFGGSLLAAPDPRAHLLHCVRFISFLFMAIRLLINLGFFLSAPLSTLLQCECNSRLDTAKLLSWKVSFTSASSPFLVTKEGFMYLLFVVRSLFMVAALPLIRR